MAYVNPLHTATPSSSAYSSLSGAVPTVAFTTLNRRRVPQPLYVPASKWKQATAAPRQATRPITFDYLGHSRQGVPMKEFTMRSGSALAQMIQGANDQVFPGIQRITFHILWPGYTSTEWSRSIDTLGAMGAMSRAQLGAAVAAIFARFIEKAQYEGSSMNDWRVGPRGIRFESLVLISVFNISEGNWQADIAVDF